MLNTWEFNDDEYDFNDGMCSIQCRTCNNLIDAEIRHNQVIADPCNVCGDSV